MHQPGGEKKVSAYFGRFPSKMKECCREIRELKLGAGHLCCRLLLHEFKSLSINLCIYISTVISPNFCQETVKVAAE